MSKVSAIPTYNLQSVSDSLRQLANRIDDGQIDVNRCVVVLESPEGQIEYAAFGEDFTAAHAAGILMAGVNRLIG